MRVAIQGKTGSFHHLAARRWFDKEFDLVTYENFAGVFEAVSGGQADQGVVAIENSLYGSINPVYDLLAKHHARIIGEISERVHQQLIGLAGADPAKLTAVVSHHVALEQCSEFLSRELKDAKRIEYYDTAAAVDYVKRAGDPKMAAIGSKLAAELAGLPVIHDNIENDSKNYTRFVIIALDSQASVPAGADKSSLIIQTSNKPGALYRALGIFADAGVNLTKLQSRPIPGKVWRYQFYMDAQAASQQLQTVISKLKDQDCAVTVLGEYRADTTEYED